MKVQILQLEPHDDLASARDKLAWAQAQRVILVWPDRARVLRKRLDLVLLRRQAARQGIQLGIVTRDPIVLDHATALGIPTFRSSTRLPEENWQLGRDFSLSLPDRPEPLAAAKRPARGKFSPLPPWLRVLILGMVALVLAIAAATILPSATIILHPETTAQDEMFAFTLDPQAKVPTSEGRVPARQVLLRPSGDIRVTTSGQTLVPGSKAFGEVVFTNLTDELVLIPAGTGVLPAGHPDLRFVTTDGATLPAGIGATAGADVVAAEAGEVGNLPAGELNAIDGPLGLRASVSQPGLLTGGTQISRAAVASADHAGALRTLTEQLLSQAASEIEAQLGQDETLSAASLRVTNTLHSDFDRAIGEPADSVGLSLTIEVAGLVYRQEDVAACAALVLGRRLPGDLEAVPGSLTWAPSSATPADPGSVPAQLHQLLYAPISREAVTRIARGRSPVDAVTRISEIGGQSAPPEVRLTPSWWPAVTWLEVRIRVQMPWELP